jgi:hypothetical protein
VAIEYYLYTNFRDVNIYRELDMFEVKVHIIFLGTVGFSPLREGRYSNFRICRTKNTIPSVFERFHSYYRKFGETYHEKNSIS